MSSNTQNSWLSTFLRPHQLLPLTTLTEKKKHQNIVIINDDKWKSIVNEKENIHPLIIHREKKKTEINSQKIESSLKLENYDPDTHILSTIALEVINRPVVYKHFDAVHKHIFMTKSLFILQSVIYTKKRHYRITEKNMSARKMYKHNLWAHKK